MENENTNNEADTVQHLHKAIYALIGGLILASLSGIWVSMLNQVKTDSNASLALEMAKDNAAQISRNRDEWMEGLADVKSSVSGVDRKTSSIESSITGMVKTIEAFVDSQDKMAKDVKESRQWQLSRQRLIDSILDRNTGKGRL